MTAVIAKTEQPDTVLGQAKALMEQWTDPLLEVTELTPEFLDWATATASEARAYKRQWEAHADGLKRPHLDACKQIRADYNPIFKGFEKVEKHFKGLIDKCLAAARERETKALQAAASQGREEVAAAVATVVQAPKGYSSRADWAWEVVDLDKVPREYLIVDEKRLNTLAREQKGKLSIPGIKPVRKDTGVLR